MVCRSIRSSGDRLGEASETRHLRSQERCASLAGTSWVSQERCGGMWIDPEVAGYVEVRGGRIWFRTNGSTHVDRAAVVCITGGPGMSHHYMYPFLALADERPVVLYDQLDTGNADRPGDPANWRIERFVDEIGRLIAALDLDRVVLVGNSWGTIVALEAYFAKVPGIVALVLSSPVASVRRWSADAEILIAELPEETQQVVARALESGDFDSPEFEAATREYNRRHIMTSDPVPDYVQHAFSMFGENLYVAMNGPSEFTILGEIRHYDREHDLSSVDVPTLVTCGEFDSARPDTCRHYASLLPNGEAAVFAGAAHFTFVDRPDEYIATTRRFLADHHL
jgi:proline-specific peptidase